MRSELAKQIYEIAHPAEPQETYPTSPPSEIYPNFEELSTASSCQAINLIHVRICTTYSSVYSTILYRVERRHNRAANCLAQRVAHDSNEEVGRQAKLCDPRKLARPQASHPAWRAENQILKEQPQAKVCVRSSRPNCLLICLFV